MIDKKGRALYVLTEKPSIIGWGAVVGKFEGEGPLGGGFDKIYNSDLIESGLTWEAAESHIHSEAIDIALKKSSLTKNDIDLCLSGDLLNQCVASAYSIRAKKMPYIGLYGACSTMALSLGLAAIAVESGCACNSLCATSSHFCSAERQFRFPLEYGGVRPPTAQRTVTGSGAMVLSKHSSKPYVNAVMIGKIEDYGITDANNMGAAMAPAAALTINEFLTQAKLSPMDFDMILTGDLGSVGSDLLKELLQSKYKLDISNVHRDCGIMIYDSEVQDVHAGGSGCGCSAVVLCSEILNSLMQGNISSVLFVGTGALMSTTMSQQGESIPGIAHAVWLKN